MSYNKVTIIGNLTRDPEVKFTAKGTAIANLSLAVNRTWRNDAGEKQEETTFVDCTAFGKTAEMAGQYFKKGKPMMIEGRLKTESWEDKQTQAKRSKLTVIIEQVIFLPANQRDSGEPEKPSKSTKPKPNYQENINPPGDDTDIPF